MNAPGPSSPLSGSVPREVLARLKAAVGAKGWTTDPQAMRPYLEDRRGRYLGRAPIVVRPDTTAQVSAVLRICAEAHVGVVPQGGNTGLVGGSVPDETGAQVVLSLGRMHRVRALDPVNFTITVEAGCVLADVQAAAADAGLAFPLSLAAEGSCQIGGNLATNAGGTAVIRYGNARALVLGLEVVLADGRVWDGLRALRKDNAGYALKQLFLGSEGTLGVITAAVLELFPRPREVRTALVALPSPQAAVRLLARCREAGNDALRVFEYWNATCMALVLERIPGMRDPLGQRYPHYALLEFACGRDDGSLDGMLGALLEEGLGDGLVLDATIAESLAQREALWALRENIPEAQRLDGPGVKHDISVPGSRLAEFLEVAEAAAKAIVPDLQMVVFGHLGDGNIHLNMNPPASGGERSLAVREEELREAMYALVARYAGSFSAEHGIGRAKRDELKRYRGGVELELMQRVKQALDPQGILNPGKVV